MNYQPSQYLAVSYWQSFQLEYFLDKWSPHLEGIQGNDFEVTFLRAKDDEHKIFSFPTKEDCSWVERKEILSVVDGWVMDKRQRYLFSASLPVTE